MLPDDSISDSSSALVVTLDTNVLVAGLRSSAGASHWVLEHIDSGTFQVAITQPVFAEYEGTLRRPDILDTLPLTDSEVCEFLDYLAEQALQCQTYYQLRPSGRDVTDDKLLECAFASSSRFLVTFNVGHYVPGELTGDSPSTRLGFRIITPGDLVKRLRLRTNGVRSLSDLQTGG